MDAGSAPSQEAYGRPASPSTMTAAAVMLSRSGPTTSSSAQAMTALRIATIPHRMAVVVLELGVVHVAAADVRLTFCPDTVEVSGPIVHGLRVVPVRMVETSWGLVIPVGCRNGDARLGAPVRGTIGAAAHVHIPDATLAGRAGARAGVIAARAGPIIHPNDLDDGRAAHDGREAVPDSRRGRRQLCSVRPRGGVVGDVPGRTQRVGILRVDPFRHAIGPGTGVVDYDHPVIRGGRLRLDPDLDRAAPVSPTRATHDGLARPLVHRGDVVRGKQIAGLDDIKGSGALCRCCWYPTRRSTRCPAC